MTNGTTYMSELTNGTTYVNKVTNGTTCVSKLRNGITYVSKLTSGMTYVSKLTGGTIYVSKQTSGTTYVSKVTSGTTYVSKVTKGTTYVSKLRNGTIYVSKLTNGTVYVSKLTSGTTYGVFLALCALQGLLALEGELTPILVQMVKSANTNGLLDGEGKTSKAQIVWVYTVLPCCVLWQGHRLCECYTVHPTCVLWHVWVTDCVGVVLYIPAVSYVMSGSQIVWVLYYTSQLCLMSCLGHRLCGCCTIHPSCVLCHVWVTDCVLYYASKLCLMTCPDHMLLHCIQDVSYDMSWSQIVTPCIQDVSYGMSWSQIVWVLYYTSQVCLITCPGHRLCECYTIHPRCVLWHALVTDCVSVILYIPGVSYNMPWSQIVWVLYYTSQVCLITCPGHRLCECYTIHPRCVLWHALVTDCVSVILYIPGVSYDMPWSQIVWVLYIPAGSYEMSRSQTVWVSWSQIVTLCIPAVSRHVLVTYCVSVLVTDHYTVHPSCVMTCPGHRLCESYHASQL